MGAGVWHSGRPSPDGPRKGLVQKGPPRVVLASVMTPPPRRSSSASRASLIQLSVQDAPKLQGRRKKIAKMGSAWEGGVHTVHRAATSDNLILGTGRGWTAENKERWTEAEDVRGFEVVHQRSVSRMIRHAVRLALG